LTYCPHWVFTLEVAEIFKDKLRRWRGKRYQKEAADLLGIPFPSYRKYEYGKRTPNKLAMAELERRMLANGD
jgi:hypothetical protein